MRKLNNRLIGCTLWVLYSNILIYASFYYNWKQLLVQRDVIILILTAVVSLMAVLWMKKEKSKFLYTLDFRKNFRVGISVVVCTLLVTFFYFGKSFLYEESGYWMTADKLKYFMLLNIPILIYVLLSMEIFDMLKQDIASARIKNTDLWISLKAQFIILFAIQALILLIYFYALNPGNMSYDTYNQTGQLRGTIPFNTWHPIGHTLFTGLLLSVWNNYAVITIFQIIFFAAITSSFYTALLKNGIKPQIIYAAAVIMAALPSVGINVVTQWKDIPFTVGILWGTLILFRMSIEKSYFSKLHDNVEFIMCMLVISLFRFNGILAFAALLIFAFIYVYRGTKSQKRNCFIASLFILIIFFTVNTIIPKKLDAVPNPAGMKLRPIYQGYSAMYVFGGEDDLNPESRKLIETVSTPKQMNDFYNPYFADTISSNTPKFLKNLSKISTKDALKIYLEALKAQPGVVLGDKFNLSVTMWSVTNDRFSYNNAYTTSIEKEMIEEFGVKRKENKLTEDVKEFARITFAENYLSNTLVWRTGFYLALEFILILYLLVRRDKRISLFLPMACNGIIVFLTMPAQDYRYLWFIFLLFPFLVLACSVNLDESIK